VAASWERAQKVDSRGATGEARDGSAVKLAKLEPTSEVDYQAASVPVPMVGATDRGPRLVNSSGPPSETVADGVPPIADPRKPER